ncbi:MAG: hypothetical protein GY859_30825, partial [Desulfobacterales bacterium]|nr:hypothetical protein [Desulfobacterales bacterium]
FFHDNRHVIIARDFRFVVMDSKTGEIRAPLSHASHDGVPPIHSPFGNFAVFGGVVASSLYNLTASLGFIYRDSSILIRGVAADFHFDQYILEYAGVETPDQWRPIQPPVSTPVVNGVFCDWVPPGPGLYYVRLTVSDLAGNSARVRKRVSWGRRASIAGIHPEGSIFSPNGDGVRDEAVLRYSVLAPVHLEFLIYDDQERLVRTLHKDYPAPPGEGGEDHVVWDGRDEHGGVVMDGLYRVRVLDLAFEFEVDNTPPAAEIGFGPILCGWVPMISPSEKAENSYTEFKGAVYDANLKGWVIEYGEGDAPEAWSEFERGAYNFGEWGEDGAITDLQLLKTFTDLMGDLTFPAGRRFRVAAEDLAGNKT